MKAIILPLLILIATAAFANDDGPTFSDSFSTPSFDPSPVSSSFSDGMSNGGFSFGGNSGGIDLTPGSTIQFGGNSSLNNFLNPLNSSSDGDSSTASSDGGLFGSDSIVSSAARSMREEYDPTHNSLVSSIIGQATSDRPSQEFMALIFSRSPIALFLDLNGNGVRGDLMDGLLFSLLFPNHSNQQATVVTNGQASTLKTKSVPEKWIADIEKGLAKTNVELTGPLSDGRVQLPISDLVKVINGYDITSKLPEKDRAIGLESILRAFVLQPALAGERSPLISRLQPRSIETYHAMVRTLRLKSLAAAGGLEQVVSKNQKLEFPCEVAISRFAAVVVTVQQAMREKIEMTDFSKDAIRAALYAVAFELKRLKISEAERGALVTQFVNGLNAETLEVIAPIVASSNELSQLREGLTPLMPRIDPSITGKWGARITGLAAGGLAIAGWMSGGIDGVEYISSDVGLQYLVHKGGYIAAPVLGYLMGSSAIQKARDLMTPQMISTETNRTFRSVCDQALTRIGKTPN